MYKINNIILIVGLLVISGIFLFKKPQCKARISNKPRQGVPVVSQVVGFSNSKPGSIYAVIEGNAGSDPMYKCIQFSKTRYPPGRAKEDCMVMDLLAKAAYTGKKHV
jgi:hypothetical protein